MSVWNREHRTRFQEKSRSLALATGDTPTTVGVAFLTSRAGYTLMIQGIRVHVITAAAQAITFQDDALTPKVVAKLPASAAVGDLHELLESEEGIPCTEGKNFDIVGTAGVGAMIEVMGYLKPTGTIVPAQI
jgi:hypothetical protein